ncbi:MAG: ASKHA domain-containing protein [Deltaproteobacteria bacterium]|nr:ASKHA domain-containing protein [Deltaproteobacteria bacterium]
MSAHLHDVTLTLVPSGVQQIFPVGTILADALFDMGVEVTTPCGGRGTCGKCGVTPAGGEDDVLACRTPIMDDMKVHAGQAQIERAVRFPAVHADSRFSAAVDIGTTTVKISLVDISRNISFEVASFLNPQRRFGHDVISRIAAGSEPSNLKALQDLIRKAIAVRLCRILKGVNLAGDKMDKIIFSGNTTMLYLLFGFDVQPLGRHPYPTRVRDFPGLPAGEIGLEGLASAHASALPVLSAFIGADLVGALALCHDHGITRNAFFIDMGTNGELFVLDGSGRPYAASCAMGPALEGMNISWGMTADAGAITHVFDEAGSLRYEMIGQGNPAGIAGTALVDLVAMALDKGIVSPRGSFARDPGGDSLTTPLHFSEGPGMRELCLWDDIRLTQQDIRQVQLAKAASLSASRFLLEAAGCRAADIEHVLIAGAFGEHLDLQHFSRLGFIPDFPVARQEFLGNTSLKASEKACREPDFIERAAALRDRAQEVVLSRLPGFQDVFIQALDFPV